MAVQLCAVRKLGVGPVWGSVHGSKSLFRGRWDNARCRWDPFGGPSAGLDCIDLLYLFLSSLSSRLHLGNIFSSKLYGGSLGPLPLGSWGRGGPGWNAGPANMRGLDTRTPFGKCKGPQGTFAYFSVSQFGVDLRRLMTERKGVTRDLV
jgi:hypothetical protein